MLVRHIPGGAPPLGNEQWLHRFPNGYGASVVRGHYTYGGPAGFYELAVARWYAEGVDDWSLCYDSPITNDVIGHLNSQQVADLLARIAALPRSTAGPPEADGARRGD